MVFELFTKELQEIVKKRFETPTLAQTKGIPAIMSGKNVLIIAPTGIGKTESAILPLLDYWIKNKPKKISILYITPLRALNRDLLQRLEFWARELGMEVAVRHGDTTPYERQKQSQFPSDLLITTPETLQAVLPGSVMQKNLSNVKFIVVDEIHELVNSKRGVQLSVALERLRELCGEPQIIGLSATVGNQEEVAKFLVGERKCEIINAAEFKELDIKVESAEPTKEDAQLSSDLFIGIETAARLRKISEMISKRKSVLIFTNTREFAEILSSRLKKIFASVETHHGSLSKEVRMKAEQQFKKEEIKSLIATSSLELGIDIGSIDLVIQYQSPRQVTKLIQRVGRSGHGVGRTSEGVIITTDIDDCFESAIIAKRALAGKIEEPKIHRLAADVLAHQIVGLCLDKYQIIADEAFEIIKKSYTYAQLKHEAFISVCKQLHQLGLIYFDPATGIISRRKRGWTHYFENLSTIPSVRQYKIFDTLTNQFVGTLDEEFIALHGEPGTTFVCKGQAWRIFDVVGEKIIVEPVEDIEAAIPAWEGELIPVPYEIAQGVSAMFSDIWDFSQGNEKQQTIEHVMKNYPVDEEVANKIYNAVQKQKKFYKPSPDRMFVEIFGNSVVINSPFGSLVNNTIGQALTTLLSAKIGSVNLKINPYRIILTTQTQTDFDTIKNMIMEIKPDDLENILRVNIPRTELFTWRFIHNAKRFGVLSRDARFEKISMRKVIDAYAGTPVYEETFREIFLEKMDLKRARDILNKIQKKEIELQHSELSFLGRLGLKAEFGETVGPERPEHEILKIFKERLLSTKIGLLCANCGGWSWHGRVREAPEVPKCTKCGAKLIAMFKGYERRGEDALMKSVKSKKLTDDEKRMVDEALKTADLVITSGKKAVMALAGRGVGASTAVRLLSRYSASEDDFFKEILAAEKQFARTKRFWR